MKSFVLTYELSTPIKFPVTLPLQIYANFSIVLFLLTSVIYSAPIFSMFNLFAKVPHVC